MKKLLKEIIMKKISLLFACAFIVAGAFAQSADEIVSKFIAASGGAEKLNSINTLQYHQQILLKTPMGNFDIPLQYYKDKNKLFRLQAAMSFGGQSFSFYSIVNDTAGYVMLPANPMLGTDGGLKKMVEKERQSQLFQMDVAGMFAPLVNYADKGHKVELLKDEKVKGEECYRVKLTLASGQVMNYAISKATNLVVKADAKGAIAASMSGMGAMISGMGGSSSVDRVEISTIYSDYKNIDGLMFPTKVLIKAPMGDSESEISNIKVNQPIDPRLYKAA